MKTIAFIDRAAPHILYVYNPPRHMKRIDRICEALKQLKHVGNIKIFYQRNSRKPLQLIKCVDM